MEYLATDGNRYPFIPLGMAFVDPDDDSDDSDIDFDDSDLDSTDLHQDAPGDPVGSG